MVTPKENSRKKKRILTNAIHTTEKPSSVNHVSTHDLPADVTVLTDLVIGCSDVTEWVVAKLQICLQQHEKFNSQRAMQQPFPALCGSGLYFLF